MSEHLPPEKLKLLLTGRLRGGELADALDHVETCDVCYQNLPEQTPEEVLGRLLGDDEEDGLENFSDSVEERAAHTKLD